MKTIQVGGNKRRNGVRNIKWALVDKKDFEVLSKYVWTLTAQGYAERRVFEGGKYKHILMHRQILGKKVGVRTDHKNRNRLDNRRKNLRSCDYSQNAFNKGLRSNNSSGIPGVSWDSGRNKWMGQITAYGKTYSIGRFRSKKEAIKMRKQAERKYFKDYAIVSV